METRCRKRSDCPANWRARQTKESASRKPVRHEQQTRGHLWHSGRGSVDFMKSLNKFVEIIRHIQMHNVTTRKEFCSNSKFSSAL